MGKIISTIPYEYILLGYVPVFMGITFLGAVIHRLLNNRNIVLQQNTQTNTYTSLPGRSRIPISINRIPDPFLWISFTAIVGITLWNFFSFISQTPTTDRSFPAFDENAVLLDQPIRFILNVPVDFSAVSIHTNPEFEFDWKGTKYVESVPFGREIIVYPRHSLPPDTKIMMYLSNLKNPFSTDFGSEYLLEFTTASLPDIVESIPPPGAYDISGDIEIRLLLSATDIPQNSWDVEIVPMEFISINRNWGKMLSLKFAKPLKQNTRYTVSVFRTPLIIDLVSNTTHSQGEKAKVYELSFSTVKAPLISTFVPDGDNTIPTEPIEITFDEAMNQDSVTKNFSIQPVVDGEFSWKNEGKILVFKPEKLEKNTEYSVVLQKGLKSSQGGILEQDVHFRFKTAGVVSVSSASPADSIGDVAVNSPIHIRFNQEVNKSSAEEKFSINPPVNGTLSWDDKTLVFTPAAEFEYGRQYTYKVSSGIKSVYGYDSASSYSYTFTTAPQEYALSVPYFKQQENFTCNIASVRMLLAFRGITKSEAELKQEAGTNGTRGNGNPYLGFVANYGTYWDAIARVAGTYRSYRLFKEWTLGDLLGEVRKGSPVMIWGQNGWSNPHEISWTASDGTFIYAINGMHSYIVRGWRGPIENPTHILVNDPWRGVYALTTSEFVRRWNYFKVALIVD